MTHDFDRPISRANTNALATEGFGAYLLGADAEPLCLHCPKDELIQMWVADMQFAAPEAAIRAIAERLQHPIFGYTMNFDDRLYEAFVAWCDRRYGWTFPREQMVLSLGVIPALLALVEYLCGPDDKVLTLSPAYGFFKHAAEQNGQTLVTSALSGPGYEIDFADFEAKANDPAVKVFFLCHPHNPTGRRWTEPELRRMAEICFAHGVKIISDEIHCDLLRSGLNHTVLASLFPESRDIITCMAVSKTFNLAGMMLATIVIPDPDLRAVWRARHYPFVNPISLAAAAGAYEEGEAWLDDLRGYLDGNFALTAEFLQGQLPKARFTIPEATYLLWIDLNAYFPEPVNLTRFFLERSGVVLEGGEMFVADGEGHVRLNLACPRMQVQEALQCIADAIRALDPA